MDVSASHADPLAQATRARLFEVLIELRRPASTRELAGRLGRHPNGIRSHLDQLHKAGLVARERVRQARGRPRDMWVVSAEAQPAGGPPTAYVQLGRWLARAIKPARASLRHMESTGRRIGRELAPEGGGGAESRLYATIAALGFQPRREPGAAGRLAYRLCNCPYREAVDENPDVVCTLHRGMTLGLLDELDAGSTLAAFVPRDPSGAGCLIELSGAVAAEGLERLRERGVHVWAEPRRGGGLRAGSWGRVTA